MFGRAYISSISSVDGQAAFLKEKPRDDHISKMRSAGIKRAFGLPQKLSSVRTMELLKDSKISELHRHLCELRAQGASHTEISVANRQFRIYRNRSKRAALDKWKEDWLDDRYRRTIESEGHVSSDISTDVDQIQALFRVMPERARLANMIISDDILTRDQTLSAVQDLLSLCQRDFEVMYRPGDEPDGDSCPVCHLQLPDKARDRPDHIYHCRYDLLRSTSCDVHYCFFCFRWFLDAVTWEQHCLEHLMSMNTVWCGIQTYCHTVICPGCCPFCLSNEQISASKRLRVWTRNYQLMEHVEEHLAEIRAFEFSCPHPLCDQHLDSMDLFRHHLSDIHGLSRSQKEAFDAERDADVNIQTPVKRTKKRKLNDQNEPIFVAWSPSRLRQPSARKAIASKINIEKRRRVEDENKRSYAVFVDKLDEMAHITSEVSPNMKTKSADVFLACTDLGEDDSNSTIRTNDDEDQGTAILSSSSESLCEKTLVEVAIEPILQTSSVVKSITVPIDPALSSINESSVSNIFTQASKENKRDEKSQSLDKSSRPRRRRCSLNPIVIPKAQLIDLTKDSPADQEYQSEDSFSLSLFADDNSRETSSQCASKVASGNRIFKCPICNREVPPPTHNKLMKFSLQKAFCENHQKRDAELEWTRLGYPRIAWQRLNIRMSKKASALLSFSFFRTELQRAIDKKEARKYRCVQNMTAGYYGPRGQQIMSEYILTEFGSDFRRKASVDPFLRVVGVADYVNTVLIPELAVMLIMEDMQVTYETAREILQEST